MSLPATVTNVDAWGWCRNLAEAFCMTIDAPNTETAYRLDLFGCGQEPARCRHQPGDHNPLAWLPWCRSCDLLPLTIRPSGVELWLKALRAAGQASGTRARRLSAVSAWYRWMLREDHVTTNPVALLLAQEKPKRRTAGTAGRALTADEVAALLQAADADSPRSSALIAVLFYGGLRVTEAIALDTSALGVDRGQRRLTVLGKGEKPRRVPLPPPVVQRLDAYLASRHGAQPERLPALAPGGRQPVPLFATSAGTRLVREYAYRLLQRLARQARIGAISPHDLRRTFATLSLGYGAPLDHVQDAMGHADPATTRGYDRRDRDLADHPANLLARKVELRQTGAT